MYRATTPTIILNVNTELDLSMIEKCHVTIKSENGGTSITYNDVNIDIENNKISFTMTQEETLKFNVGKIKLQIRAKLTNGAVVPSNIIVTTMNEILEESIL